MREGRGRAQRTGGLRRYLADGRGAGAARLGAGEGAGCGRPRARGPRPKRREERGRHGLRGENFLRNDKRHGPARNAEPGPYGTADRFSAGTGK